MVELVFMITQLNAHLDMMLELYARVCDQHLTSNIQSNFFHLNYNNIERKGECIQFLATPHNNCGIDLTPPPPFPHVEIAFPRLVWDCSPWICTSIGPLLNFSTMWLHSLEQNPEINPAWVT